MTGFKLPTPMHVDQIPLYLAWEILIIKFSSLQPLCGAWSQARGMMIVRFIYLHLYMQCNQSTKSNSYDTFGCSFF